MGLAGWTPKEKSPIAGPDDDFIDFETCKAWNIMPWDFRQLSPARRADLLAHEYIKAVREGAYADARAAKTSPKEDKGASLMAAMQQRYKPR